MFIKRSRYDSLVREMEGQLNEIEGLRDELKRSLVKNEKYSKQIGVLYDDSKTYAKSQSLKGQEIKDLKTKLSSQKDNERDMFLKNFVLKEFVEPSPKDAEQRALYTSRIAGYFNGGLTDYINYLLAGFRASLAQFPLSEREADFYRASINVCHILNEWGEETIREHHANARGEEATTDAFEHLEEEDEAVENIKKSVN